MASNDTITNVSDLCDKLGVKRRRMEGRIPLTANITTWDFSQDDLKLRKERRHGFTSTYSGGSTMPYETERLTVNYQGKIVLETEAEVGLTGNHYKKVKISSGEWEDKIENLLA